MSVAMVGDTEVVFDWTDDRCEEGDIPDLPVRAFRDADGHVQLVTGHPPNIYRLIGDDLDSVAREDCTPILTSGLDKDPAQYDFKEWIGALYTPDGQTIHALVHSEYHGWAASDWHAEFDFSDEQGRNDWRYQEWDGATISDMTYDETEERWEGSALFCSLGGQTAHPGGGCDANRTWVSPINDTVTVTGEVFDLGIGGGDGVNVSILRNDTVLWSRTIDEGETDPVRFELPSVAVSDTDRLHFRVRQRDNANFDATHFDPEINRDGDPCLSDDRGFGDCLRVALTHARSMDAGKTYASSGSSPDALVANPPVLYEPDGGTFANWQPSNIIRHPDDGMYYALVQRNENPSDGSRNIQGTCVIRTDTLGDPGSWRAWDGDGFNMQFVDPYRETVGDPDDHWCAVVSPGAIGALTFGLSYNEFLDRFVAVGAADDDVPEPGFYFSTSEDLIEWSNRQLLLATDVRSSSGGTTSFSTYPTFIDPDDSTRNFERPGQRPFLYFTRFNATQPTDADLLRMRVEFRKD